jgi:hypothetical protein
LAHIIGLQQFAEFGLDEVELLGGIIYIGIELLDEMSLLIELVVDLLPLLLQPLSNFVDLIQMLFLLIDLLFLKGLHLLTINIYSEFD